MKVFKGPLGLIYFSCMDGGSNERVLKAPDEGILKGHLKQNIFLLTSPDQTLLYKKLKSKRTALIKDYNYTIFFRPHLFIFKIIIWFVKTS